MQILVCRFQVGSHIASRGRGGGAVAAFSRREKM